MRNKLLAMSLLLFSTLPATAEVSVSIGLGDVSIGINLATYPELEPVPGYPVYYAPRMNSNYFFYDGMYWVLEEDDWYASTWYNGPWRRIAAEEVPLYVLRIPVRYYRHPPAYFRGWRPNAPPRWGEHWGSAWEQRRSGWDQWNRKSAPRPAPLPAYQRKYSGDRYPVVEQQQNLHGEHYRYRPRDPEVRQRYQAPPAKIAPVAAPRLPPPAARERDSAPPRGQRDNPPPPAQRYAPQPRQGDNPRQSPAPNSDRQDRGPPDQGAPRESMRGSGASHDRGREKDDDRGQERRR